jgi:hypothetical protein
MEARVSVLIFQKHNSGLSPEPWDEMPERD